MRLGFVGASLVAHVAVVGLAVYAFEDIPGARTPSATLRSSGLVAVELTPDDEANPSVTPSPNGPSPVAAVAMREPSVNAADTQSPRPLFRRKPVRLQALVVQPLEARLPPAQLRPTQVSRDRIAFMT